MEQVYLNDKPYSGKAAYINGYNGYNATEDDGLLCALLPSESGKLSCWNKYGKPNVLTTKNGEPIKNTNARGSIISINEAVIEKAVSKAQQRFFGMVDAYKKGEMPDASPAIKKAAKSMTKKEVKDFAKTKHKGLPEHIDESVNREMEEKIRKTVREMLKFGELPKDECVEMAEYYNSVLDKAIGKEIDEIPNGDENCCCSIVDDEFRKHGGKQELDGVKNHEKSVKKGLAQVVNEHTLRKIVRMTLNELKKA